MAKLNESWGEVHYGTHEVYVLLFDFGFVDCAGELIVEHLEAIQDEGTKRLEHLCVGFPTLAYSSDQLIEELDDWLLTVENTKKTEENLRAPKWHLLSEDVGKFH